MHIFQKKKRKNLDDKDDKCVFLVLVKHGVLAFDVKMRLQQLYVCLFHLGDMVC